MLLNNTNNEKHNYSKHPIFFLSFKFEITQVRTIFKRLLLHILVENTTKYYSF